MAFKSAFRAVVLAGVESSYGQGATTLKGLIVEKNLNLSVNAERIERNILRETFTPMAPAIGAKNYGITLTLELKGGDQPECDPLLRACGMELLTGGAVVLLTGVTGSFQPGETVSDGTSNVGTVLDFEDNRLYLYGVATLPAAGTTLTGATSGASGTVDSAHNAAIYKPKTDLTGDSAEIVLWRDGIKHRIVGARGTFEVDMTTSQIGKITFTMTGLYADPISEAEPSAEFDEKQPKPCIGVKLFLEGASLQDVIAANSLQVRLGADVTPMNDIKAPDGRRFFYISDRRPDGSIDPYVVDLDVFNPWEAWKNAGAQKIAAELGDTAGNMVRVLVPKAVYNEISYDERGGLLAYRLPFTCTGNGDDELYLIFW